MTRQNKAVQKKIIAKQFTALHLAGQKGPAQTKAIHGKVKTVRALERIKREAETLAAERDAQRPKSKAPEGKGNKGSKYAQKRTA
jgi:hypothetical protein